MTFTTNTSWYAHVQFPLFSTSTLTLVVKLFNQTCVIARNQVFLVEVKISYSKHAEHAFLQILLFFFDMDAGKERFFPLSCSVDIRVAAKLL